MIVVPDTLARLPWRLVAVLMFIMGFDLGLRRLDVPIM